MFIKKQDEKRFLIKLKRYLLKIARLIFKTTLVTFIVYFALEQFKIGLISNYFDLNILLILAIITGILLLLFDVDEELSRRRTTQYLLPMFLAILAGIYLYRQFSNIGPISILLTIVSLLALYTIFSLNLNNHD